MPDENWSSRRQSHGNAMKSAEHRFDAGRDLRKRKEPSTKPTLSRNIIILCDHSKTRIRSPEHAGKTPAGLKG